MAVNDIVGIQIHGRYQSQNIVNVMHYKILEQISDEHGMLQMLCSTWDFNNKLAWLARHIDTYSLMGYKAFNVSGENKQPGILHVDEPGVVTGTEVPSPVCRVVTLYTDSDNYRRHGRIMLSGSETLQFDDDDGSVTAAEIALLNTLGGLLIDTIGAAGDSFMPGLAPTDVLPFEGFTGRLGRKTPALIRSRRVRTFGIG